MAATLQFLIRTRALIQEFEENVGGWYSLNDDAYEHWVISQFGSGAQELRFGVHYRRWIRTLHAGNPNDSTQLEYILSRLSGGSYAQFRINCHRFGMTMQRIYKILSNEMHAELLSQPSFINPAHIDQYISILPAEMRNAVHVFYLSTQ